MMLPGSNRPLFGLNETVWPRTLRGHMHRREYIEELERRCGKPADYLNQIDSEDGPVIGILGFDNYPLPGHLTYFSHGLHLLNKPQWVAGRPEYFITID